MNALFYRPIDLLCAIGHVGRSLISKKCSLGLDILEHYHRAKTTFSKSKKNIFLKRLFFKRHYFVCCLLFSRLSIQQNNYFKRHDQCLLFPAVLIWSLVCFSPSTEQFIFHFLLVSILWHLLTHFWEIAGQARLTDWSLV